MNTNQLHINLSKCAHMYFKPNINNNERMSCARSQNYDINLKLSINGVKVKQVDRIRFLGVIIDDKLTWDAQIEHLENKLIQARSQDFSLGGAQPPGRLDRPTSR